MRVSMLWPGPRPSSPAWSSSPSSSAVPSAAPLGPMWCGSRASKVASSWSGDSCSTPAALGRVLGSGLGSGLGLGLGLGSDAQWSLLPLYSTYFLHALYLAQGGAERGELRRCGIVVLGRRRR